MGALIRANQEQTAAKVLGGLTRRQKRIVFSRSRFVAAHVGRRGGKTWAIPRAAIWACTRAPEGDIIIGAESLKKAKALPSWRAIVQHAKTHAGWSVNSSEGWVQSPWGPVIRIWGLKDDGAVELLRGFSVLEAHFDEVATYAHRLDRLIDDVIQPMLGEWRKYPWGGRCFLWGTPTYTRAGPWFEICSGKRPGWEVHHWTVLDNEHYPDPRGYLNEVLELRQWASDHPTFLREYKGLFVDDSSRLCFAYSPSILVDTMPDDYDPKTWEHTLAVDFGVSHQSAWALVGSRPNSRNPESYLVKTHGVAGLLLDDASAITGQFVKRYLVKQLIGDAHGLGKPYVEAWNRLRLAPIVMQAAEKKDKRGWIEIMNDDLTTGRLRVVKGDCLSWCDEVSSLPWDDKRLEPSDNHPNDSAHAALYAYRHHRAHLQLDTSPPAERVSEQEAIEQRLDLEATHAKQRLWFDR